MEGFDGQEIDLDESSEYCSGNYTSATYKQFYIFILVGILTLSIKNKCTNK